MEGIHNAHPTLGWEVSKREAEHIPTKGDCNDHGKTTGYGMGIEIDYDSIETAHRIPAKQKKLDALKYPPVLIARFHSQPICRQILSLKGALSQLHAQHPFSKVKISEDLSRHNLEIFSTARATSSQRGQLSVLLLQHVAR
ncbi:unnamed protein product [Didymodactylos carnosus]|uniref:Uncharacterized protein n=1 Tax=Didymodactylos carnosus TaxID=1234261 RepID=A0A815DI68_9BILA|nr:unnamed protein product [Didymodactylos carnosus]CAF1293961.1 unnamed protein product [Didymodactylos carnosus]CAF3746159.1 unnamed protein product [Didymodactylos carnosus]CAF4104935.1 unnamed protein product [Didymodactylos carnosus]